MNLNNRISALIVTFNPNLDHLSQMIEILSQQVSNIIIVDNSPDEMKVTFNEEVVNYIYLGHNEGIGYAQNVGFFEAYKNSDFIITFDQDSKIDDGLVDSLIKDYFILRDNNIKVACIGPSVINERDGSVYEKYFKGAEELNNNCYAVKSIISSGTLIPVDSLLRIGINKAHWFIDSIDIEWCYRARDLGYKVIMTRNKKMTHNLGSGDKNLFFGKKINFGSDFRLYYVFRNWIFSLRETCFPLSYKLKIIFNMPIKFLLLATIPPRRGRIKNMLKGIKHGILKKY
ncbi:glycosyltransferase [Vibrio sp. CAIM 722]|uniref:Glycosyltransferase n=1 Tax=Vibrio eleionomae TaxID=2653505 RepID=A0A7X4RWP3_9VIBR|nr:glycosyltransferase [Vibrio eleionomae]MZI96126.1 glycosyltransferase [Vibrio eleionomae]